MTVTCFLANQFVPYVGCWLHRILSVGCQLHRILRDRLEMSLPLTSLFGAFNKRVKQDSHRSSAEGS